MRAELFAQVEIHLDLRLLSPPLLRTNMWISGPARASVPLTRRTRHIWQGRYLERFCRRTDAESAAHDQTELTIQASPNRGVGDCPLSGIRLREEFVR